VSHKVKKKCVPPAALLHTRRQWFSTWGSIVIFLGRESVW